jgi:hypothetical protein
MIVYLKEDLLILAIFSLFEVGVYQCINYLLISFGLPPPQFNKKFQIDVLLGFHYSHESGRRKQNGHT